MAIIYAIPYNRFFFLIKWNIEKWKLKAFDCFIFEIIDIKYYKVSSIIQYLPYNHDEFMPVKSL